MPSRFHYFSLGSQNLSRQNWKANRYGTYKDLGDDWAAKRKQGIEIDVQVTRCFGGGHRPSLSKKRQVDGNDTQRNSRNSRTRFRQHYNSRKQSEARHVSDRRPRG